MSINSLFSYGWEILTVIGALGFFIFGMKIMSDGIQKAAGDQLRTILRTMTSNRFSGLFTGFVTTSLIQSSSATTVMVVSFVNAGLLRLREAIGVIMGANIGTTVTGLLIALFGFSKFSLADATLPILAIGFPMIFSKKDKVKNLGEFIIGFALLFMGLDALKGLVPADLKKGDMLVDQFGVVIEYLNSFGIFEVPVYILIGTLLTVVVQSSSAAMAITLVLCNSGLIPFEAAAAIILGENIGTTITANIAALVGNVHAKRAARAHFVFNVMGVLWMIFLFSPFTSGISWLTEFMGGSGVLPATTDGTPIGNPQTQQEAVKWGLVFFHVCFNVINTMLLIWFVPQIEKFVIRITKGAETEDDQSFRLRHLGGTVTSPELTILAAYKEMGHFGEILTRMLGFTKELIDVDIEPKRQKKLMERIVKYEEITDRIEEEIGEFLSELSEQEISEETSKTIRRLMTIIHEQERIGDLLLQIAIDRERIRKSEKSLRKSQISDLTSMLDLIEKGMVVCTGNIKSDQRQLSIDKAQGVHDDIDRLYQEVNEKAIKSIQKGKIPVKPGLMYKEMLGSMERIGAHQLNITELLLRM